MKKVIGLIILLVTVIGTNAQIQTYSFASFDLPNTAQISGLGGINVSRADYSVNLFQNNPALASDTLNGWGSANYLAYFAGTGLSSFAYQHDFEKLGSFSFGINHLNLGSIDGYDIVGMPTGTFVSGETSIVVGKSHQVNAFRLGVNVKGVFSQLASYRSSAVLLDIGGVFVHPKKDLSIGMVIKNAGLVLSEFSPTGTSRLPFDVQAGISYKPEHMPIRFSGTAYRLTAYSTPYEDVNSGSESSSTLDKVLSHLTLGTELLLHRNVNILLGYNFLRHQELKLDEAGGGSGFSIGALVKVKQVHFALSRSGYVTGGAYQLSLDVNTRKILTRR